MMIAICKLAYSHNEEIKQKIEKPEGICSWYVFTLGTLEAKERGYQFHRVGRNTMKLTIKSNE